MLQACDRAECREQSEEPMQSQKQKQKEVQQPRAAPERVWEELPGPQGAWAPHSSRLHTSSVSCTSQGRLEPQPERTAQTCEPALVRTGFENSRAGNGSQMPNTPSMDLFASPRTRMTLNQLNHLANAFSLRTSQKPPPL
ncbi:uncharacterized protein WM277_020307 [Molossus nigricans]